MPSTKTLNQSPTISAVENTDLLWVWDSSASELNKISRTNLLTTTDDFNTSYARLAGRSGGQTLIGGTAANDDLTLEGTSNATRTTSYVILQPTAGNVGIGVTNPANKLQIGSIGAINLGGNDIVIGNGNQIMAFYQSPSISSLYTNTSFAFMPTDAGTGSAGIGNVGIGTLSPLRKLHVVGTILIDGDENGIAGTIGLTDVFDATLSSGTGTVKLKGTTARNSAGFIKVYVGTTTAWIPYWTDIS